MRIIKRPANWRDFSLPPDRHRYLCRWLAIRDLCLSFVIASNAKQSNKYCPRDARHIATLDRHATNVARDDKVGIPILCYSMVCWCNINGLPRH